MIDLIKQVAQEKLMEQFLPNSLNQQQTQEASKEGVNFIMGILQDKIAKGGMSEVMSLFNGASNGNNSGLAMELISKLAGMLQKKGMNASDAQQDASSAVNSVIATLSQKFLSTAQEDKGFDLGQLEALVPANSKGLFGALKGILGK